MIPSKWKWKWGQMGTDGIFLARLPASCGADQGERRGRKYRLSPFPSFTSFRGMGAADF